MQIDTTHIDAIRASFKQMQTKEDFLKLLNYAKPHAYAGKTIPFEMKQLNFYLKNRKPVEQSVLAIKDDVTEKPVQNVMLLDIRNTLMLVPFFLLCFYHN